MTIIEELRAKREALLSQIEDTVTTGVTEDRDLTEAEDANVDALRSQVEKLDARINQLADLQLRKAADAELASKLANGETKTVTKVNEPELYRENGEYDFLSDVTAEAKGNPEARERLYAHNRVEHQRATVTGDLGGFIIPDYAVSRFADTLSEGRPTADLAEKGPLTNLATIIPRQTSSTAVDVQNPQNTAGGNADFEANNNLTITAATITGYTDIARQSVDFGQGTSALVMRDLLKKYDEKVNDQVINGTGLNSQIKGILASTGIGTLDGSSIADEDDVWHAVSQAKTVIRSAINAGASHVIMHPELFGYLESSLDSEGRPKYGFGYSSPTNVVGSGDVFNSLRVVQDSAVPFSAGVSQDVIVVKANELLLLESGARTLTVEQVGAHTGTIRYVIWGYAAFTAERRPEAVNVIEDVPTLNAFGS